MPPVAQFSGKKWSYNRFGPPLLGLAPPLGYPGSVPGHNHLPKILMQKQPLRRLTTSKTKGCFVNASNHSESITSNRPVLKLILHFQSCNMLADAGNCMKMKEIGLMCVSSWPHVG